MEPDFLECSPSFHRGQNKVENEYRVLVLIFDLILASLILYMVRRRSTFLDFHSNPFCHLLVHHKKITVIYASWLEHHSRVLAMTVPYLSTGASLVMQRKQSACKCRRRGSIPGSGRSPGEGNGNPLQHSCQEYPIDRGAWQLQSME